jgi:hypothetical protein
LNGEEIADLEIVVYKAAETQPLPAVLIGLESQSIPPIQPPPAIQAPAARPTPPAATLRFRPSSITPRPAPPAQPKPAPVVAPVVASFVDPAILSYARTPIEEPDVAPPYPMSTLGAQPMTNVKMPIVPAMLPASTEEPVKHTSKHEPSKTYDYVVFDNDTQCKQDRCSGGCSSSTVNCQQEESYTSEA